jgi:hypothetical protein
MQDILISTKDGPRMVRAYIIGPFAVHVDCGEIPIGYTVTHLFTGLAIVKGLSFVGAKNAVHTLPQIDDWYFGALDLPDYTEWRGSKALKQRVAASRKWLVDNKAWLEVA